MESYPTVIMTLWTISIMVACCGLATAVVTFPAALVGDDVPWWFPVVMLMVTILFILLAVFMWDMYPAILQKA